MPKSGGSKAELMILKLVTGGHVIGNVSYNKAHVDREYHIHKPLELMQIPHPEIPGKALTMVNDFIPGAEPESLPIAEKHVVCRAKPHAQMAELYKQVTEPSDIVTPPEKSLIIPGSA